MNQIHAMISNRDGKIRILVQEGDNDLMIAKLGPLRQAHRYALRSLIEGIALWHHEQVHIVLCVEEDLLFNDELVDALGIGVETLHFRVDVVPFRSAPTRPRGERLRGLGSFASERRHLRLVPSP